MRPFTVRATLSTAVCLFCTALRADLISVSATAPTINGADIAQLAAGGTDAGGDQGHIWSNRPVQGQTFTTLSNPAGYFLHSVTLQNLNNNISNNAAPFTVRVGTVSGTTFTPVATASSTNTISYVAGDFLTFNFTTPILLGASTVFGFDWDASGNGFVTTNNSNNASYTGGEAFSSGAGGVPNDAALVFRGIDRTFHLDLSPVPEPSSVALLVCAIAGGAGLSYRQMRRRGVAA